jgi:TonB family protein
MRARILLSAVCLACLQLCCLAQDVQARAEAMMNRARHLSDIRSKNALAFRLKATFSFTGKDLESAQGTYTEIWISGEQWRRETVVNDFHRVEVGTRNRIWKLDNSSDVPETAARLPGLFNIFPSASAALEFDSITPTSGQKVEEECLTTKPGSHQERSAFCFEEKSGALLEVAVPDIRPMNSNTYSCLYGTFRRFGDYSFPREIACFKDKHRMVEAKIEEISAEPSPDAALFQPPAGAIELGNCPTRPTAPKATRQESPSISWGDSKSVMLALVVGTKGKPQNVTVLESGGKHVDDAARDAVSQWRFIPATCNGEPIPAEINIRFDFGRQRQTTYTTRARTRASSLIPRPPASAHSRTAPPAPSDSA